MVYSYYDAFINKKTRQRYDVTPLFQDPEAFSNLLSDLVKPFSKSSFNKIAGIDALGFILGSAIAFKLGKSFIPIRKGGRLPGVRGTVQRTSFTDYSKKRKTLEMNKSAVKKGDRVLVVDDWMETGQQAQAAVKLIEKRGGKVAGIAVLCAEKTPKTRLLFEKYKLNALGVEEKRRAKNKALF